VEQSKYVEEPQHDTNDHDGVQDGLNTACHGDEAIHQPQQNTNYDENAYKLNQRHDLFASFSARRHTGLPVDEASRCWSEVWGANVEQSGTGTISWFRPKLRAFFPASVFLLSPQKT
jgi:hypothetical protein